MKRYLSLVAAALLPVLLPTPTLAQPIPLSSTWGEYDLQEQTGYSAGLLTLSAQSSTGFTALIGSNGISTAYPPKSQWLPRIYTTFVGQPITNNGQRVTFSFDVRYNNVADSANTGSFRISMGDTNCNNAFGAAWNLNGGGTGMFFRYDSTISQDPYWTNATTGYNLFEPPGFSDPSIPTNVSYGSFCDLNGTTMGGVGGAPNGVGTGVDTTTVQHIRFSVERTPSGLQVDALWGNSAGPAYISSAVAPIPGGSGDDHSGAFNVSPWTNVNVFGFCLFGTGANQHFFGYNPGGYTISNLKGYSGFKIVGYQKQVPSGDDVITWESSAADVCEYVVLTSSDLTSWTSIATNSTGGYFTSYTNSAPAVNPLFYRIQKQFP